MERRPAVDTGRGRVEPEAEHQIGGVEALVEDRLRQVRVIAWLSERRGATDLRRAPPSPLCSSAVQQGVEEPDS